MWHIHAVFDKGSEINFRQYHTGVVSYFLYSVQITVIKLIDLSFNVSKNINSADEALRRFKPSLGYIDFIKQHLSVIFIACINNEYEKVADDVRYLFFKGHNSVFFVSLKILRYIKNQKADVIFVQGLSNPFQVICLRRMIGKKPVIIVQHHGEQPLKGVRRQLQKIADSYIDGYLFTAKGNAQPWVEDGMIQSQAKCYEVLEASTFFVQQDRETSRRRCNMQGHNNFLWVGRLDTNKDPLTVLKSIEQYAAVNSEVRLYMIYHTTELLPIIKELVANSPDLQKTVRLIGEVAHEELPYWYSAADFYISGSHREGSGYALLEAMACGCIPVVTDIPPFRAIMGDSPGFKYEKGNTVLLLQALMRTNEIDREKLSGAVAAHFKQNLSFERIAHDILQVCEKLVH